jgi:hypothetical protein
MTNARATPFPSFPHFQKPKMGEGVAGKAQIMDGEKVVTNTRPV